MLEAVSSAPVLDGNADAGRVMMQARSSSASRIRCSSDGRFSCRPMRAARCCMPTLRSSSSPPFCKTPRLVNLRDDERERIAARLGREPSVVELHAFDAAWSEHCSYKSSRSFLKRLPVTGARVVLGPGEDAGMLHLGNARRRTVRGGRGARIAQSPVAGRAIRRRRDRHRRHRSRRTLHGRRGDRRRRRVTLRSLQRRRRAPSADRAARGRRHRRLWQCDRGSESRGRRLLRSRFRRKLSGERRRTRHRQGAQRHSFFRAERRGRLDTRARGEGDRSQRFRRRVVLVADARYGR